MTQAAETVALACPLCEATPFRTIKKFADGVVVGECLECGLLYTPLRHPSPDELLAGVDATTARVLLRPIAQGRARHFRQRAFLRYLRVIRRHARGLRLLDVGCAHGFFPALARQEGYTVTAVEPSPALASFAREELGLEVLPGRLDQVDLGARQWDVVTFTDSAEYLPAPVRDLRRVASHLAPGGLLFVKVPNGGYFRTRHAVERHLAGQAGTEQAFSPSRRVVHYTLKTLRRLVEAVGLEVIEISAAPIIDSPAWYRLVGLSLEMQMPWRLSAGSAIVRRLLGTTGALERLLWLGHDHFSQSIYALGRKKAT
jgi:2-polyprenyl-3-methyl-5-hydroxy-6-metoxy-1,4-benzoquinol methylase